MVFYFFTVGDAGSQLLCAVAFRPDQCSECNDDYSHQAQRIRRSVPQRISTAAGDTEASSAAPSYSAAIHIDAS